jgi:pyruvate dehydrogenase E1 component
MPGLLRFAFEHLQAADGGSVYLRLSTRPIAQPERDMTAALEAAILAGGYWLRPPAGAEVALVGMGAVLPELLEAADALADDLPGLGVLVVTSADRLHGDWRSVQERRAAGEAASAAIEGLLAPLAPGASLVTVLDGHPATLAWLGSATARRVYSLGVDRFGQSGDIPDLYRAHQIDAEAILDRVALACTDRARSPSG